MTAWRQVNLWMVRMRAVVRRRRGPVLLTLATWRARARLSHGAPVDVLVDTSVLGLAVAHESKWVSTGSHLWGDIPVSTGYLARVPVRKRPSHGAPDYQTRDFEETCYLTGIAHLARIGAIRLRSSGELEAEQWRQSTAMMKGSTMYARSLFEGLEIIPIDGMPDMVLGPKWMGLPTLGQQQRERLAASQDPLFLALLNRLGPKSSQDAWHIRTAEVNGLYCFLTADHALIRNLEAQRRHEPIKSLRTKVLTPAELGKLLKIFPLDPRHTSYEGASFPVRADLHMPDNKRPRIKRRRPR